MEKSLGLLLKKLGRKSKNVSRIQFYVSMRSFIKTGPIIKNFYPKVYGPLEEELQVNKGVCITSACITR